MPKKPDRKLLASTMRTNIKAAKTYTAKATQDRAVRWDRFYGKPLGNEQTGRSQYMSRDVMDAIEWMMPHFMRTFASGDPKIDLSIKGQDAVIGKALMQRIQDDLNDNDPNMFRLFYQWFKDALVSDTAAVKHSWDHETESVKTSFDGLGVPEMQVLSQDEDVEIEDYREEVSPMTFMPVYNGVKVTVKRSKREGIYNENVPHWELIVSPNKRQVNDEHGIGTTTKVSVDYLKRINEARSQDGEPYFRDLDKVEEEAADVRGSAVDSFETSQIEGQEQQYMDDQAVDPTDETDRKGGRKIVRLVEWYDRYDVNGDGMLEDCTFWFVDDVMIRWEENEEGFIPISVLSPIIDCYKFSGMSFAEILTSVQNLKTMITRRILESFDFSISGRWRITPGANVDLRTLLNNVPGEGIFAEEGALEDISPKPMDLRTLSLLEYADTVKENASGITRYNQGMDADSLNKTATGIAQIQSAAQQRIELVSRVFAETGLRDFYRKAAWLYQRYLKKPFSVKVNGKDVQVAPEQLKGEVCVRVNLGIETMIGQQETQKIERVRGFLGSLQQAFPGLITPKQIHAMGQRYVTAMGFSQVEDFLPSFEEAMQYDQQLKQQQAQMMQGQAQQMAAIEQGKQQLEGAKLQQKAQEAQQDAALDAAKIAQDERESKREGRLDLAKLFFDAGQKQQAQQQWGRMNG